MSKYKSPNGSSYNVNSDTLNTTIFYYGEVIDTKDNTDGGRIKVRIKGVDNENLSIKDLPYAFPMLQKHFHVVPKKGETVFVFIPDIKNPQIDRLYLGPIISQPQKINSDIQPYSSKSSLDSGIKESDTAPSTIPETKGLYPSNKDVAVLGRNNSDILLKDNETLLRAGKYKLNTEEEIQIFNKSNPSYVQIKHGITNEPEKDPTGVINVVSDKINLLTHKNGNPRFKLNDQDKYITDEELNKILEKAHPLVFGDKLIEYLKILKDAFLNHVHPYPGLKPEDLSGAENISKYNEYDLESLISKNIRIN